jgi:hypothetical protein
LPFFSTDKFMKRTMIPHGWIGAQLRDFDETEQEQYVDRFMNAYHGEPVIEGFVPSHIMVQVIARLEREHDVRVWVATRN